MRMYRRTHPEHVAYMKSYLRAYNKKYRAQLTRKRREARATWSAERIEQQREYKKDNAYRRKYGISLKEALELLAKQGGCGICTRPLIKNEMNVDHCHATGIVRGILCSSCNTAIGLLGDTPESINRAIQYVSAGSAAKNEMLGRK